MATGATIGGIKPQYLLLFVLSVWLSCFVITRCDGLTTFGRQAVQAARPGSGIIRQNSNTKQDADRRRVMVEAFENAGQRAGLEIWRIENFEPKAYPTKEYGKFYTGDSYIVLYTKERKGSFSWDIHFWLGKETSQDESGAAAIFTVHLDDQLGGAAIQHREVQNHESQLFLSYFKSGIRYAAGGISSGFTHVDRDSFEKRLFHVKGKRNIRVWQVEPSIASMNLGDCFILDVGKDVYVFCGKASKRAEKLKAISAANQIRDQDHNGRARVHIIDDVSNEAEVETFFTALGGGSLGEVPEESAGGDDSDSDNEEEDVTLNKVSESSGTIVVTPVAQKPLRQNMLDTNNCYIIDTADFNIYVWIGRNCKQNVRSEAMKKAEQFLSTKNYPSWVHVQRVVEGAEPAIFRQHFQTWQGRGELHPRLLRSVGDEPVSKLEDKSGGQAPEFMPDDGTGSTEIFRVVGSDLEAVPSEAEGKFFGQDSYVIKYQTADGSWIIYIWQGQNSPSDTKFNAFIKALDLDEELGGGATIVIAVQNYEPKHLLHLFKGKLITFMGGHATGFNGIKDHDTYTEGETRLYRIRGSAPENARATQLEATASSLESDDVFLVENDNNTWLWIGKYSDDVEKDIAREFVEILAPGSTAVEVAEDEEPEEFWDALGGEGPHNASYEDELNAQEESRLFHIFVRKSKVKIEEIYDFTQEDLVDDDVMILETPSSVFFWAGANSTEEERELMGKQLKPLRKHNRQNEVLFFIKQGQEPANFISNFPSWDNNLWESAESNYVDVKSRVEALNASIADEE